jgi:hypothetical protein
MGVGIGDFDLDGHIDLVKTHFVNQATGVYRNNGKGEFEEVTAAPVSVASAALPVGVRDWSISTMTVIPTYSSWPERRPGTGKALQQVSQRRIRASSSAIRAMELL